jgi:hypothetical protein
MTNEPFNQLDVLKHIETLVKSTNEKMQKRSKNVLHRYPITFALLVGVGLSGFSEGLKGIWEFLGLKEHSLYLFIVGALILILTGTLYKKLDKSE